MRSRKKENNLRKSIKQIIEQRSGEESNSIEYLVSFNDTFEPIENISASCYPMIEELQPGLLEKLSMVNEDIQQIGIDISESEIENDVWEIAEIVAVKEFNKVILKNVLLYMNLPNHLFSIN